MFFSQKKGLLKVRRPTKLSEESIKMQFQMPKMKDGRNLHPKSTIHLTFLNLLDPSIIAKIMLSVC